MPESYLSLPHNHPALIVLEPGTTVIVTGRHGTPVSFAFRP